MFAHAKRPRPEKAEPIFSLDAICKSYFATASQLDRQGDLISTDIAAQIDEETRLLSKQAKNLYRLGQIELSNDAEVAQVLKVWFNEAILGKSRADITDEDRLILSICHYFNAKGF